MVNKFYLKSIHGKWILPVVMVSRVSKLGLELFIIWSACSSKSLRNSLGFLKTQPGLAKKEKKIMNMTEKIWGTFEGSLGNFWGPIRDVWGTYGKPLGNLRDLWGTFEGNLGTLGIFEPLDEFLIDLGGVLDLQNTYR